MPFDSERHVEFKKLSKELECLVDSEVVNEFRKKLKNLMWLNCQKT
jgi:hypothetical protein